MMESCMTSAPVPQAVSHHHQLSCGTSTFHPPPNSLSLSSASSSASGSSCASSGGSGGSTTSGSNSGLNARTPIQSLPHSMTTSGLNGGVNLYQVHDGFATVRKRKGHTAASIAIMQQQECYDLAQPAAAALNAATASLRHPPKTNGNKKPGGFMQRASFRLGSNKDKKANPVLNNGNYASSKSGSGTGNGYSASLLSTHPSIARHQNSKNSNGFTSLIPVRKQQSGTLQGNQSHECHSILLLDSNTNNKGSPPGTKTNKKTGVAGQSSKKDYRRNSLATSTPWETSGSVELPCRCTSPGGIIPYGSPPDEACPYHSLLQCSSHHSRTLTTSSKCANSSITNAEIHKTRLKPTASNASNNSSLGRKLRRLVLPNKLPVPPPPPIASSPDPSESPVDGDSYEYTINAHPHPSMHSMPMSKSYSVLPSSGSSLSSMGCVSNVPNGTYASGNGHHHQSTTIGKLRNSISDNSIVVSEGSVGHPACSPSGTHCSRSGVSGSDPNGGGVLCQSSNQNRNFHRSCFLPKAPLLEPVMEDGIPWRQTRKDVPWWELATRRGRYRSCPVLQVSQQAHVVAAFEQSLSNMTQRIQSLTSSAEQKDSELIELRQTIESLRKQSIEAGLTVASMTAGMSRDGSPIARQLSADSVSSINSISSACSCTSHSHTSSPSGHIQMTPLGTPTHGPSANSCVPPDSPNSKKKHAKNKGWLRSSFTKAFSRSKSKTRNGLEGDYCDTDSLRRPSDFSNADGPNGYHHLQSLSSHGPSPSSHSHHNGHHHKSHCGKIRDPPRSPLLSPPQSNGCSSSSGSHSPRSHSGTNASSAGGCEEIEPEVKSVDELKKQLREKEMVLTDIRLEALTSAHQLESLKETVNKMRNEMLSLKQDNDRLQKMVTCKSLTSSQTSLQIMSSDTIDRRLSASEVPPPSASNLDVLLCEASDCEGKRIIVTVFLGCHGSYERYTSLHEGFPAVEVNIGSVSVSNKTKWDVLDAMVKRTFKEYLARVDPPSHLGLSADSVMSYNVGEVLREKDGPLPELLPCGYLVGDVIKIRVCLKGARQSGSLDALAFETLVPKPILQRYVSLLNDHGRIILCGPSGTGKSYLARKMGEYLVARCGKDPCPEAIATFSADHKNSKELRQYLANLAEQCDSGSPDLPSVIILDNLHQVASFGDVFSGFVNSKMSQSPIIIGTMSQSSASSANLQLHNFRWVLFGNHMEPVKGLLCRFLTKRLIEVDVQNGARNVELARVMDWIPKVWQHINRFLELHNSTEVTIGPRLFLSCPTDVSNSQVWFTDLWHYSIVPYLIEAVKEGLQLYGRKAPWEDPCIFLLQTYPWSESHTVSSGKSSLLRLRPEDVGHDNKSETGAPHGSPQCGESNSGSVEQVDPLMNMLMRLQEAANYSGPHSSESTFTSLDSQDSLNASTKDVLSKI